MDDHLAPLAEGTVRIMTRHLRGTCICAFTGSLLLAHDPVSAHTRDPDSTAAADSILNRPPVLLDPITVVGERGTYRASRTRIGTKTDTRLLDVPQSITVITRGLIADQQMSGLADVVRYVPGVTMGQGEGNRDQPT